MTKIEIDVKNVSDSCLNHLSQVSNKIASALDSLNSVDLPFYCGSLNDSINSLNSANNNIKEVDKKLRKAIDFVNGNENEITSKLGEIDGWKLPV